MARRATLIDSLRTDNPNTILVDAGNFSETTADTGLPLSRFICRGYDLLGYDAICLSPRELLLGADAFDVETPIVMANVALRDGLDTRPAFDRYVIRELRGGHRVGIFGILTQDLSLTVRDAIPNIVVDDPYAVTEEILHTFESADVDLVVLLSQLSGAANDSLLAHFPGIDVAVCGDPWTRPPRRGKRTFEAHALYPRTRGQSLARLTLTMSTGGDILDAVDTHTDVQHSLPPKPEIETLVTEFFTGLRRLQAEIRETQAFEADRRELSNRYLGGLACARCHEREHDAWQRTRHATAYQTLSDLGLAGSPDCLRCHVVGYGSDGGFQSAAAEPFLGGVQCESCHGLGSEHFEPIPEHRLRPLCVGCHDEENSPDFDLETYVERIRHW